MIVIASKTLGIALLESELPTTDVLIHLQALQYSSGRIYFHWDEFRPKREIAVMDA